MLVKWKLQNGSRLDHIWWEKKKTSSTPEGRGHVWFPDEVFGRSLFGFHLKILNLLKEKGLGLVSSG